VRDGADNETGWQMALARLAVLVEKPNDASNATNGRNAMAKGTLQKAWGYQGDPMHLPVRDVAAAVPFYEMVLGFRVLSRGDTPHRSAVLARDTVTIGLAENGGDPTQDGCAFHVKDLDALLAEFQAQGLEKALSDVTAEQRDGGAWRVFYVVAPDGLCYWFGERQAGEGS